MFSARVVADAFLDHIKLGTAGMNLVCVRRALENVGNLKSEVQVFNKYG